MMDKKELNEYEKKNNKDFLELCSYIEKEILMYESVQKLQKKAVLRLRGLSKGQTIANNKCQQYGDYPYEVILLAFKANKRKIVDALNNKNIDSEENKIAYASAIVRDNLNDIYSRFINAKKSQEKIDTIDTNIMAYSGAEYKSNIDKNDNKNTNKFKDLW